MAPQTLQLDAVLVFQQLASACMSNNLAFVVQWLADHHGQAMDLDWPGLLKLAQDSRAHNIVYCLLRSGRFEANYCLFITV